MSRQLPPNPSLVNLKKQAKALLKAQKENDPACCGVLRLLLRFKDLSDDEILAADLGLQEAQHALARDYGFRNWGLLRQAAGVDSGSPEDRVRKEGDRVWVDGVGRLACRRGSRRFARASRAIRWCFRCGLQAALLDPPVVS